LKFEEHVWGEDYYFEAAKSSIKIYLHLYDNPSINKEDDEPDYSKMTAAEKKKAKAVARKKAALAKKKEVAEKKKSEDKASENGGQKNAPKKGEKLSWVEEDPEGKDLLNKDPLEEARKLSSILSKHSPNRVGSWALQFDVAIRRKKGLMALQALCNMKRLDPKSPLLVTRLADFAMKMDSFKVEGPAKTVLTEESESLFSGKSLTDFVADLTKEARSDPLTSLPLRCVVTEVLVTTKAEDVWSAAKLIVDGGINSRGVSIESCRDALGSLKRLGKEASSFVDEWIKIVKEKYPLLNSFD
jgi:peptide alpha-N-acetyltransferase